MSVLHSQEAIQVVMLVLPSFQQYEEKVQLGIYSLIALTYTQCMKLI